MDTESLAFLSMKSFRVAEWCSVRPLGRTESLFLCWELGGWWKLELAVVASSSWQRLGLSCFGEEVRKTEGKN
jgi:hypothetical protein